MILYKKTTFLFNLFAIPLAVIIAIFSDEILGLYTSEMLVYKKYLILYACRWYSNLSAGSSGTFMIMAGLEKQNLKIQLIRALLINFSFFIVYSNNWITISGWSLCYL